MFDATAVVLLQALCVGENHAAKGTFLVKLVERAKGEQTYRAQAHSIEE